MLRVKQLSSLGKAQVEQRLTAMLYLQHCWNVFQHCGLQVILSFDLEAGRLAVSRKVDPSGSECLLQEPGQQTWRKVSQVRCRLTPAHTC